MIAKFNPTDTHVQKEHFCDTCVEHILFHDSVCQCRLTLEVAETHFESCTEFEDQEKLIPCPFWKSDDSKV